MRVTIAGFLTDYKSRVLLHQPEPGRLSPIAASLESGELPADTLAHTFRAATGLVVWPVRLVGVYFIARGGGELVLSYRCTLRGGELQPPPSQPPAAFFDTTPRPRGLSTAHARQLDDALGHAGGPAITAQPSGGLLDGLRRPKVSHGDAPDWAVTARLVVNGGHGQVGWVRGTTDEPWRLPSAAVGPGEAPWETAERLRHTLGLDRNVRSAVPRLIVVAANRPALTFVCAAELYEPPFPRRMFDTVGFAAPHRVDEGFDAGDRALAAEVLASSDTTLVRLDV